MGFVSNYRTYFLILFSKKVSDLISSKFKLEGLLLLSCPPHNFKSNIFTLLWFEAIMLVISAWSFVRNQIHLGLLGLGWTHILIHLWPTWTWPNIVLGLIQLNQVLVGPQCTTLYIFKKQIVLLQTQQLSQLQWPGENHDGSTWVKIDELWVFIAISLIGQALGPLWDFCAPISIIVEL